jgi:hypothetical protein
MGAYSDLDIAVSEDIVSRLRADAARSRRWARLWLRLSGHGWRAARHVERAWRLDHLALFIEQAAPFAALEAARGAYSAWNAEIRAGDDGDAVLLAAIADFRDDFLEGPTS